MVPTICARPKEREVRLNHLNPFIYVQAAELELESSRLDPGPGAMVPEFESPCASAASEPTGRARSRDMEELADWLAFALSGPAVSAFENTALAFEHGSAFSIRQLASMKRSDLLMAIEGADPLILGELWRAQSGEEKGCATASAPPGACTYDVQCASCCPSSFLSPELQLLWGRWRKASFEDGVLTLDDR